MSQIIRYKNMGATFAEDLGSDVTSIIYSGTELVDSPYGKSRYFNGSTDFGELPFGINTALDYDSPFMIMGRFKCDSPGYIANNWTSAFQGWGVYILNTLAFGFMGNGGVHIAQSPSNVVTLGEWTSFAIICDGLGYESIRIYLNSVEQTLGYNSVALTYVDNPLRIGNRVGTTSFHFGGEMDEIIIYKGLVDDKDAIAYTSHQMFNYMTDTLFTNFHSDGELMIGVNEEDITPIGYNRQDNYITQLGLGKLQIVDFIKKFKRGGTTIGAQINPTESPDTLTDSTPTFLMQVSPGIYGISNKYTEEVSDGITLRSDFSGVVYTVPQKYVRYASGNSVTLESDFSGVVYTVPQKYLRYTEGDNVTLASDFDATEFGISNKFTVVEINSSPTFVSDFTATEYTV